MEKAWHVQDVNGDRQEIVFAESRAKAIYQSEAYGWVDYIDIRIKRAKYADGLENNPKKLKQVMLKNSWWFECYKCWNYVDIDNSNKGNVTNNGNVLCDSCFTENRLDLSN